MPKIPDHPDGMKELRRELDELRKRVRQLEGQTRVRSTVVGSKGMVVDGGDLTVQGGGSEVIKDGGSLTLEAGGTITALSGTPIELRGGTIFVIDDNDQTLTYIGWGYPADTEGHPQPNIVFKRVDGTDALVLNDDFPGVDGYHQTLRIYDRNGHYLMGDDPSGEGMGGPTVQLTPVTMTDWNTWPHAVDVNVWVTVAQFDGKRQMPDLETWAWIAASDAMNVEWRWRVIDQFGGASTIAASGTWTASGPAAATDVSRRLDATTVVFGDLMRVQLEVRRTSGPAGSWATGTVESINGVGRG